MRDPAPWKAAAAVWSGSAGDVDELSSSAVLIYPNNPTAEAVEEFEELVLRHRAAGHHLLILPDNGRPRRNADDA